MAIVNNFYLRNQKKKLAGAVYYQAMGQTRSRELRTEISNPRTQAQMEQRTKWANLVNFYRVNAPWMKFAYETKKRNQSEYNKFMSLNVPSARIYLPKSIASQGGCVVDAYQMTQGSLPSIETTRVEDGWDTNIFLPANFFPSALTTVGEITQALLSSNPAFREGDQLSFIRFTQQTNSNTGVPFVVVRKYEFLLNSNDFRPVFDFWPIEYVGADEVGGQVVFEVMDSGNAGGFLLVLSRTIGGKTYVSSQSIVVANNAAMIEQYSSAAAQQAAIDSYGESEEPFLTTTTAEVDQQASVAPSIVSVEVDGQLRNIGESFYPAGDLSGASVSVRVSQNVPSGSPSGYVDLIKGGRREQVNLVDLSVSGPYISGSFPDEWSAYEEYAISDIYLTVGDLRLRAPFLVPNAAYQEGLD